MDQLLRRIEHLRELRRLVRTNPVVLLLGARQVGKTTIARDLAGEFGERATFLDMERPADLARLEEPALALEPLRGLVVLDEIQQRPGLFPLIRVLADRPRSPARFLLLGSASPELLRQGSESLAGRMATYELQGFDLEEVGVEELPDLWFRGGFPRSYLARSHRASADWRRDFIRTFLERDLPRLGITIPARTLGRFWTMVAHYHGQTWNGSELGRAFGVSHTTVRNYLDLMTSTYVVRELRPWSANTGSRLVKSPKVYVADSGILHALLDLDTPAAVESHPKVGASWEGFVIEMLARRLRARSDQCFFWGTHGGAELDLLVTAGTRRLGFEIKRTDAPRTTASMRSAMAALNLDRLDVVHAGRDTYPLGDGIRALAASDILKEIRSLR
jgi:uncharacterized protein